ncbi:MAG: D-alanine--D-alanine ligase [Chromatiales bacterium]|nr:D-alanine--D-alanine ligase [Chromatiales bacterium]
MVYPERMVINHAEQFGRVAVLLGGSSAEREVSLVTGAAVLAALQARGIDAHAMDPSENSLDVLQAGGYQRVWNALHGRGGEDGVIQGALETMGIPYTGSGVLGSALSMDKLRSKQLFIAVGLDTPPYQLLDSEADLLAAEKNLDWPMIVKPANEGSSVGMARAENMHELRQAWELARDYDDCVLAESWITGGEYTASILQGAALPLIRIEAANVFYDYQAKYESDETRYFCPSGLDAELESKFQKAAMKAFNAIAASGWGRVDFMLDAQGRAMFLEVNTVPGMTSHSLVPMAAKVAGLDFEELVWRILETSFTEGEKLD